MGAPPRAQPAATDGDPDGEAGRRNIFKIFTN
jgi:hypothetical protein